MIRRFGIVFILSPILIICILLHIIFVITSIIWGPIYYIITGADPLEQDIRFFFINRTSDFYNWYIDKFGPNE